MNFKKNISHIGSLRHQFKITYSGLFKNNNLLKNLQLSFHKKKGRSTATGHITVRHKGGGCKTLYKKLDFLNTENQLAILMGFIYDPNRNNIISINFDLKSHKFFYSIAIKNNYPGSILILQEQLNEFYLGYTTKIKNIPVGSNLSNIAIHKSSRVFVRSAGTYATLIQKASNFGLIKLPSGIYYKIPNTALATIGINNNSRYNQQIFGKAGRNRLKGIRPTVRGIAMNPVDHPHGGRTNGGFHPVTPWGVGTRGKKTIKKKRNNYGKI
jgi:large subunit ribosomal protein L2